MMFALFRIALCSPALAAPRYYAGYYFGLQRLQRVALFDNSGGKYRRPLLTLLEQYAICNTHAAPKARMYTILILPACARDCTYGNESIAPALHFFQAGDFLRLPTRPLADKLCIGHLVLYTKQFVLYTKPVVLSLNPRPTPPFSRPALHRAPRSENCAKSLRKSRARPAL